MINNDFCEALERQLSSAFGHFENDVLRWFWCDGVLMSEPDKYYSKKFINDNRQTKLKAFIGKDGQTEYELILLFGSKALSRYARDLDITGCIPDHQQPDWIDVDAIAKTIKVQLH